MKVTVLQIQDLHFWANLLKSNKRGFYEHANNNATIPDLIQSRYKKTVQYEQGKVA